MIKADLVYLRDAVAFRLEQLERQREIAVIAHYSASELAKKDDNLKDMANDIKMCLGAIWAEIERANHQYSALCLLTDAWDRDLDNTAVDSDKSLFSALGVYVGELSKIMDSWEE